jgi:hypothetical protein
VYMHAPSYLNRDDDQDAQPSEFNQSQPRCTKCAPQTLEASMHISMHAYVYPCMYVYMLRLLDTAGTRSRDST